MRGKKSWLNECIVLGSVALVNGTIICAPSFATNASETTIAYANQLYSAGEFQSALKVLEALCRVNPRDASAYYLRGNCLAKLNRLSDARASYAYAQSVTKYANLRSYCSAAISSIDSVSKGTPMNRASADGDNDDAAAEQALRAKSSAGQFPPGTLEIIRKQAALARESALRTGQSEADNERQKANYQVKTVQERAERLNAIRGNGSSEPVALTPQEIQAARNQAAVDVDQLKRIGNFKAAIAEQASQAKADEIEYQASSLESQLLNGKAHRLSSVKLNPVGTNFYIRNYSSVPPHMIPMRAAQQIMNTDCTVRDLNEAVALTTNSAKGKLVGAGRSPRTTTSLKGKVLPH